MNMFKPTSAKSVTEYIEMIEEPRRGEIKELHTFIQKIVPADYKPHLVGSMIGYGSFHYKSKSGREGDWPLIALSNRKNYISVYICATDGTQYVAEKYKKELPKATIGRSCISFKKIADIDLEVLKKVIKEGLKSGFMM